MAANSLHSGPAQPRRGDIYATPDVQVERDRSTRLRWSWITGR